MFHRFPRRLVYAVLLLLAWFAFVADGAHALFSGSASLASNTISTGSAELLVSNSQNPSSTIFDASRPGFSLQIDPGQTVEKYFLLKNTSQADIPFSIDAMLATQDNPAGLGEQTTVSIIPVDETGQPVGTGMQAPMASLINRHSAAIADIAKGETKRFKIRLTLSPNYTDQNHSLSYDLVLTGTQKL